MGVGTRKLRVWIISLGAVLAIYLLYNQVSKTPQIDYDTTPQYSGTVSEANVGGTDSKVGTIGKYGVGTVRRAEYEHWDENTKRIDRIFGFDRLLHEQGSEWEVEKPYMNIFQRTLKCYITADKGYVQVESATPTSQPTPKDATLIGNVVIHIVPEKSGSIKESFIYLDDIDFISEMSLFSTAGPVNFVNEDAQMLGRGLELVYNEGLERLEFLRIVHLESLRNKSFSRSASSSKKTEVDSVAEPLSKPAAAGVSQKAGVGPAAGEQPIEQRQGQYYKCVFSKNVFIESPDELIFADQFVVNDIFWAKGSSDVAEKTNTISVDSPDARSDAGAEENKPGESPDAGTEEDKPDESPKEPLDVVITCDNGILVVPMDSTKAIGDFLVREEPAPTGAHNPEVSEDPNGRTILIAQKIDYSAATSDAVAAGPLQLTFYPNDVNAAEPNGTIVPVKVTAQKKATFSDRLNQAIFEGDCFCTMPQAEPDAQQDYTLSAPKLTVNLPRGKSRRSSDLVDIVASGPAELTFYVDMNDLSRPAGEETAIPAKVIAQKEAKFLSASNQVIFEGDCLCTMLREAPNLRQEYKLSAPRLTVDLPKDKDDKSTMSPASIEHLTADGGLVRLSSVKTAIGEPSLAKQTQGQTPEKLLGGIELKCLRFDHDPAQQLFLATGPGVLKFYNSDESVSEPNSDMFSLDKPCWAFIERFDTLKYLQEPNLIIADAGPQGTLLINYFPIIEGQVKYDQQATTTAGHIETLLYKTADGQTELSTLHATGGITYEEKGKRFVGSRLLYEPGKSIITVRGDDVQPCLFNGALVDAIEYDLKTGRVKTKIPAPGTLQMKK
jgi:hypothetical protein